LMGSTTRPAGIRDLNGCDMTVADSNVILQGEESVAVSAS